MKVVHVSAMDSGGAGKAVVDNSAASANEIVNMRDAIEAFTAAVAGTHTVSLVGLADRPTLLADATNDKLALKRGVGWLFTQSNSGMYLLDAMVETAKGFRKREAARPVIISVTTDGVEFSNLRHQQVLEALADSGAAYHAIILTRAGSDQSSDEARERNMVLDRGTREFGGSRKELLTSMALKEALLALSDQLTKQVKITFARPQSLIPVRALTQMGFTIEASHHEVAKRQHEIDFVYGDALKNAEKVVTFKSVTKTIAMREGLRATFMPKPIYGAAGTGMHANISLFRAQENAFFDSETTTGISDPAMFFVGGLIEHACAITAIANPLINSYKRLVSGIEAPVYITWSGPNRSSLIRIPAGRALSTRVEFRSPDPTCNPYLTFAAILAAGLDGIKRGIDPGEPADLNVYHLSAAERKAMGIKTLPANLKEALDYLEADKVIREALGEQVFENIMRLGLLEWEAYNTFVHPWEIERYINTY